MMHNMMNNNINTPHLHPPVTGSWNLRWSSTAPAYYFCSGATTRRSLSRLLTSFIVPPKYIPHICAGISRLGQHA